MVIYVPGTQEKDLTKVIMSLQQNAKANQSNSGDIASAQDDITTLQNDVTTLQAQQAHGVLGIDFATYASNADLSTAVPLDDTIPQSNEGTEIVSKSYTPKSASSSLLCLFVGQVTANGADNVVGAIFNGGSNAIASEMVNVTAANLKATMAISASYAPGSTSAQTISVRVGAGSAKVRLNGTSAARLLGGSSAAMLVIVEYL